MKSHFALAALVMVSSPSSCAEVTLRPVYYAVLAGDGVKALAELSKIDVNALEPEEAKRATCIQDALRTPPQREALPPVSNEILVAYRSYWQDSLLKRATREEAEARLKAQLDAVLESPSDNLDVASERAKKAVEKDGLFALTGVTAPFYELAIWKVQSKQTYEVHLHDRQVRTDVVFLDEFVSFGWAGFATCNKVHTGGWAAKTELYAVKSAYDLESEDFRVSYLAHEARHFSDYGRFPKLEQPELEYRAKLTELALAEKSIHSLMKSFAATTGRDRSSPHQFANYWVARNMSKALLNSAVPLDSTKLWDGVPAQDIRSAAKRLLAANDASLMKSGTESVARFLED